MPTNQSGLSPYMDAGTGAYEPPPAEVTYGTEHDPEPTGAVEGPPVSVTVESPPEHLAGPTGAADAPPASVTYNQDQSKPRVAARQVTADEAEDKAVSASSAATKKRGR